MGTRSWSKFGIDFILLICAYVGKLININIYIKY